MKLTFSHTVPKPGAQPKEQFVGVILLSHLHHLRPSNDAREMS